jgi:hypothetical protein
MLCPFLTRVNKMFTPSCQCRVIVFRLGFPIPIGHENHEINEISRRTTHKYDEKESLIREHFEYVEFM